MADHLLHAIDLAVANVAAGGGPFGAVIVAPSGELFEGVNGVTAIPDPTAHAEVQAIRAAARGLGSHDLAGCVLYSSCEPCPMCWGAALWGRLAAVVFAADRHDAAAAGFDDAVFHTEVAEGVTTLVWTHQPHPAALAPFQAWQGFEDRVTY